MASAQGNNKIGFGDGRNFDFGRSIARFQALLTPGARSHFEAKHRSRAWFLNGFWPASHAPGGFLVMPFYKAAAEWAHKRLF